MQKPAKMSVRYPWIAEHRGGPLTKEQHRQLMHWARECIMRVLPLLGEQVDPRLMHALEVTKAWEAGEVSVGDARNAAFGAIAVANQSGSPVAIAVARGVGHTVATAHMADHAPGGAEYALKALAAAGKPIEEERAWQNAQLPQEIKNLVLTDREKKSWFWKKQIEGVRK